MQTHDLERPLNSPCQATQTAGHPEAFVEIATTSALSDTYVMGGSKANLQYLTSMLRKQGTEDEILTLSTNDAQTSGTGLPLASSSTV